MLENIEKYLNDNINHHNHSKNIYLNIQYFGVI